MTVDMSDVDRAMAVFDKQVVHGQQNQGAARSGRNVAEENSFLLYCESTVPAVPLNNAYHGGTSFFRRVGISYLQIIYRLLYLLSI